MYILCTVDAYAQFCMFIFVHRKDSSKLTMCNLQRWMSPVKMLHCGWPNPFPIGSMYGMFTSYLPTFTIKHQPNVGKYPIHASYGFAYMFPPNWQWRITGAPGVAFLLDSVVGRLPLQLQSPGRARPSSCGGCDKKKTAWNLGEVEEMLPQSDLK